jgi:polyhydroxyalkanoate synthesis regulator phasin
MVVQSEAKGKPSSGTYDQASKQVSGAVDQAQQMADEGAERLSGALGKLSLAAIGGMAIAGDAGKRWFDRMVERGEEVEKNARKQASEIKARGQKMTGRGKRKMEEALEASDLPTKHDVQDLHDQIAALSAKIDQLTRDKAEAAMPTPPKRTT